MTRQRATSHPVSLASFARHLWGHAPERRSARARLSRFARGVEPLEARCLLAGDVIISELMASNDTGLRDEDQQRSDWIELLNNSPQAVDLGGWFLTDDAEDLDKWEFPSTTLQANQRLLVFASGKNRRDSGQELHTNFRLGSDGEYLALVQPNGLTVDFEFTPAFPPQIPDISYGLPQAIQHDVPLVPAGGSGRLLVPSAENHGNELGTTWTAADFDAASWVDGVVGIGYERATGYESYITTDVESSMYDINRTAFLRLPFNLEHPERVSSLTLNMQYDDGYVAYINGQEVARKNAPSELAWNSGASAAHADRVAVKPEAVEIVVSDYVNLLQQGDNVLAIHALNDTIDSSDFLIIPQMTATIFDAVSLGARSYFAQPTPGSPNGVGSTTSIRDVSHQPVSPSVTDAWTITARITAQPGPPLPVALHYRIMFGDEATVPMFDDGQHGDGLPLDGVYGVTLPSGLAAPSQMIRYRITAGIADSEFARAPRFQDPLNHEEYFGTVIADPSIQSNLPVIHTFLADPAAANIQPGTRGAVYYDGQFYDNVEIDPTGRSVGLSGPKKSHDLQFTSDHWFELNGGELRMNDFDIISDFWNREKMRVSLGYQTLNELGTPAHLSFQVRLQQNGQFYGTYFFVDGGNEQFLARAGVDPTGALYKMNLGFGLGSGQYKKQTRTYEDHSDLRALFAGLALTGEARTQYLLDNVNMAGMVNFLVGLVIMGHGDCCGKNLYVYRDTEGTGDWQALPWDVDSAFGRGGVAEAPSYFPTAGGIFAGLSPDNSLITALFADVPGFREMYLRRLRTLMDKFVQPPGTPESELYFEQRIDAMIQDLAPDAALDFPKWGSWKTDPLTGVITFGTEGVPTWQEEVAALRNGYLPARRVYLYDQLKAVNGGIVLEPQAGSPTLQFGAIDASPVSGNQDEEYIQLLNPNSVAVDISGWTLTGGVQHTFHPGTVLPAGGTLYVTPNVPAFRARATGPTGGQRLVVQGSYEGRIANAGTAIQLKGLDGSVVATTNTTAAPSPVQEFLRISELMFNPRSLPTDGRFATQDFEFIELVNTSPSVTLDLQHVALRQAVDFQFPAISLSPGEHIVVARSAAALRHRYGDSIRIAGQYGDGEAEWALNNSSELLRLELGRGDEIQSFTYDDDWVPTTDGDGYSLTIIDTREDLPLWNVPEAWRASSVIDGTPGRGETGSGDLDGDGAVTPADLQLFCSALPSANPLYDLTGDQTVDRDDLLLMVQSLLGSAVGDVNFDGKFDSSDLVRVFQAGKFEDSLEDNASWTEGDWDCDGDFLTSDLVFAFQFSQYVVGAAPVAAAARAHDVALDAVSDELDAARAKSSRATLSARLDGVLSDLTAGDERSRRGKRAWIA